MYIKVCFSQILTILFFLIVKVRYVKVLYVNITYVILFIMMLYNDIFSYINIIIKVGITIF